MSLPRSHPVAHQPQMSSRPRRTPSSPGSSTTHHICSPPVSLRLQPPPDPFPPPPSPRSTLGKSTRSFLLRMKRASSLNFLNKSVEEPVQVWLGGCGGPGQGGPGPRAQKLYVLCTGRACRSRLSISKPFQLCAGPGFGLDPGKTNEGNPAPASGQGRHSDCGGGREGQGLWLIGPRLGSSATLSCLPALPTAWSYRLLGQPHPQLQLHGPLPTKLPRGLILKGQPVARASTRHCPHPQPFAWACCLPHLSLPRTPVFSVQSQGNLLSCHLSLSPGGWACPLQLRPLFIPSSRAPSLGSGPGERLARISKIETQWPALPRPHRAKNTKHLRSLQHSCPSSPKPPAVASVYREISYWPRPSPQSTVLPGYALTVPFSSGTAQALITPIPRGGIFQALHLGGRRLPKGFPGPSRAPPGL